MLIANPTNHAVGGANDKITCNFKKHSRTIKLPNTHQPLIVYLFRPSALQLPDQIIMALSLVKAPLPIEKVSLNRVVWHLNVLAQGL